MVELCISKCACLCVMVLALLGKLSKKRAEERKRDRETLRGSSPTTSGVICARDVRVV